MLVEPRSNLCPLRRAPTLCSATVYLRWKAPCQSANADTGILGFGYKVSVNSDFHPIRSRGEMVNASDFDGLFGDYQKIAGSSPVVTFSFCLPPRTYPSLASFSAPIAWDVFSHAL